MAEDTRKVEYVGDETEVYVPDGPVFKREVPRDVPTAMAEELVKSGRFRYSRKKAAGKESES